MKKLFLAIALLVALAVFGAIRIRRSPALSTVTLAGKKIYVEVAKTAAQREKGLSDRQTLCPDCGMLFIFETPDFYSFWMKRMYFDIDMIWINDHKVVDITHRAKKPSPEEFDAPKIIYSPKAAVDKVLEVNAGWCEKNGVKIGDEIVIN